MRRGDTDTHTGRLWAPGEDGRLRAEARGQGENSPAHTLTWDSAAARTVRRSMSTVQAAQPSNADPADSPLLCAAPSPGAPSALPHALLPPAWAGQAWICLPWIFPRTQEQNPPGPSGACLFREGSVALPTECLQPGPPRGAGPVLQVPQAQAHPHLCSPLPPAHNPPLLTRGSSGLPLRAPPLLPAPEAFWNGLWSQGPSAVTVHLLAPLLTPRPHVCSPGSQHRAWPPR